MHFLETCIATYVAIASYIVHITCVIAIVTATQSINNGRNEEVSMNVKETMLV